MAVKLELGNQQKHPVAAKAARGDNTLALAAGQPQRGDGLMDAQRFLAEFGHIANAPEGIARLRELILQLAVQGKLVPQNFTDEPARELLKKIIAERQLLIKESKLKALKSLPLIKPEEMLFILPNGWEWVRLGNIADIERGGSPRPIEAFLTNDPEGLNWIKIGDTDKGSKFILSAKEKIKKEGLVKTRMVYPGDFLLTNSMSFGRPYISAIEGCIHDGWLRIHPPSFLDKNYLYHLLSSPFVAVFFKKAAAGAVVQNLNADKVRDLPIPLPPLTEQSRIVAKVDELMALCDKLEAQQQQRRMLQNRLRQTTLQALAAAASPHELQSSWTRLEENFNRLYQVPEDVADLRKMVTELAIRGDLDTPEPLESQKSIAEFLSDHARKKVGKQFAKIGTVEELFPLPKSWRWVLLEELLADSESGWSPKCDSEPRSKNDWGVLKVSAVTWGEFKPNENKRLPHNFDPRLDCEVFPGDFLLSRANTAELVARSVITPLDCPKQLLMSDKIVRLKFIDNAVKPWINLVNNSAYAREYYKAKATGTSDSMRNVSRQVIHELPIPLPPLHVQKQLLNSACPKSLIFPIGRPNFSVPRLHVALQLGRARRILPVPG